MKPIKFKECNVTYAKNQPEYLPLPAYKADDQNGTVIGCWKPNLLERLMILFTGKIWLSLATFGKALTPHRIYAENPIKYFESIKK